MSLPSPEQIATFLGSTPVDDSIDRLSCVASVIVFLFTSIVISMKTYFGSPIECMTTSNFSRPMVQYSEKYCFLKNIFRFPAYGMITESEEDHNIYHLFYWSNMYLLVAAFIFMLPRFVWKILLSTSEIPLMYFCKTTNEISNQSTEQRAEAVDSLAEFARQKITANNWPDTTPTLSLYTCYGVVKILYLFIALAQFVVLTIYLDQNHDVLWGWHLLTYLANGYNWEYTGMFPRVTFCDVIIRQLGVEDYEETMRCEMGINSFYEKIFLFLWFWLVALIFVTMAGSLYTLYRNKSIEFVCSLINSNYSFDNKPQKSTIEKFAKQYLTTDGILILSFVWSQNDLVAQELALSMYCDFNEEIKMHLDSDNIMSHSMTQSDDTINPMVSASFSTKRRIGQR